jgi:hypothetical protein
MEHVPSSRRSIPQVIAQGLQDLEINAIYIPKLASHFQKQRLIQKRESIQVDDNTWGTRRFKQKAWERKDNNKPEWLFY